MFFSGNSSWEDSFFPFSLPPFWSSQEVETELLVFPRHTSFFSCDSHLLLCSLLVEFLHHIAHLLPWVFHFSFERACTLSCLEQYFWYLDFRLAIWFVKCKRTSLSLSCSVVLPVTRWPAQPSAMRMNVDITTLDFRKAKEQIQRIKFEIQVWFLTSSFTNGRLAAASSIEWWGMKCLIRSTRSLIIALWKVSALLFSAGSDSSGSLSHLFSWVLSSPGRSILCPGTPWLLINTYKWAWSLADFVLGQLQRKMAIVLLDSKMSGLYSSMGRGGGGHMSPYASWWPTDTWWLWSEENQFPGRVLASVDLHAPANGPHAGIFWQHELGSLDYF